jgi:uncharacterized protein
MGRPLTPMPDADATGPRLRGSRCVACATVAFPRAEGCQRCGAEAMEPVALTSSGTLWGWTVQRFAPKSPPYVPPPEGFSPFVVGYVELAEGLKVEALVEGADPAELAVGTPLRLVATEPVPRFALHEQAAADQPAALPGQTAALPDQVTEGTV